MATTINASTSGGLVQSADTSGVLQLQSAGTTQFTVDSTGVYGTLESATAVTASGTSVDFLDIPSWVKRITVMFGGVSTNGTSVPLIQLGDAGGIENTGYVSVDVQAGGTNQAGGSVNTSGHVCIYNQVAANAYFGQCIFSLLDSATNTWVGSSSFATSGLAFGLYGTSGKSLSATLDRIRITTVNGTDTFDAGTINIMCEG